MESYSCNLRNDETPGANRLLRFPRNDVAHTHGVSSLRGRIASFQSQQIVERPKQSTRLSLQSLSPLLQAHANDTTVTKDFLVEKFYRDAKFSTIGEGTCEIRKLL
ncbi:MAG: hypothetical protein SGI96_01370 [Bacteroidota bacterium]|nr:hypothetical protein [Bacteroidota bacterium]